MQQLIATETPSLAQSVYANNQLFKSAPSSQQQSETAARRRLQRAKEYMLAAGTADATPQPLN